LADYRITRFITRFWCFQCAGLSTWQAQQSDIDLQKAPKSLSINASAKWQHFLSSRAPSTGLSHPSYLLLSIPASVSITGKQVRRWFESKTKALAEVDRLKKHQQPNSSMPEESSRHRTAGLNWTRLPIPPIPTHSSRHFAPNSPKGDQGDAAASQEHHLGKAFRELR
jgi:hypothetical protein